ncbi:MAG: hypothetical protein JXA69_03895, partial [Phycisphaerae bacterium]|nr:hypothetical protein [Phycisphaerae bacterium]
VVAEDVTLVAWIPDSHRFLAVHETTVATWEEAASVLTSEQRDALISLSDRLREELLAFSGDWNAFEPETLKNLSGGTGAALLLYVRDHRREGLPEKLGEHWKDTENLTATVWRVETHEASDAGATPGPVLLRTLDEIGELRISPDGEFVACVQTISADDPTILQLSVLPIRGGLPKTVAERVAAYPDWTPDGKSLVYATTHAWPVAGSDSLLLGAVARRQVRDASGALLDEFPEPVDLVGTVFIPQMKIRCLPDGRILFSGMEVTLPSTSGDMPQRASLFSIDPERQPTVTRVIPREVEARLPGGLATGCFELSPDAKRIVVAEEGDTNSMVVLTLATGDVVPVLTEVNPRTESVPAWRTAQELSFVAPPKTKGGSPDRHELVLWSGPDQTRCLSCDWPALFGDATPASNPAEESSGAGTQAVPVHSVPSQAD